MRPPTTDLRHAEPQTAPFRKPNNPIVLSLFLKPIIMLFILSFFLFIGIATLTLLLLLAGSSLHLCRHRGRSTAAAFALQNLQNYLPQFCYNRESQAKECAVCLEAFKGGEPCRRLPDCGHVFHAICVDSWLSKVLNCPICRAPIRLYSSGGPSSFLEDDDGFKMWWPVGASAD